MRYYLKLIHKWTVLLSIPILIVGCEDLSSDLEDPKYGKYPFLGISNLSMNPDGSYTISWEPVENAEAKYEIFKRKKSTEQFNFLEPAGQTSENFYQIKDVQNGLDLCFVVRMVLEDQPDDFNTNEKCTSDLNQDITPVPFSITPTTGPVLGGIEITIKGTEFDPSVSVSLAGLSCSKTTFVDHQTIKCLIPPAQNEGKVDLTVTNASAKSGSLPGVFSYSSSEATSGGEDGSGDSPPKRNLYAPEVVAIYPKSGAKEGGYKLTIFGAGFKDETKIRFGGNECSESTFIDANTLECMVPAAEVAGVVDLLLINPDGSAGVLPDGFTYIKGPSITNISPAKGSPVGGEWIAISGANFHLDAKATVGAKACSMVVISNNTTLKCQTPPLVFGEHDIVVTNPDGQLVTFAKAFLVAEAPTITSVTPSQGNLNGNTSIVIAGTNFIEGAAIDIGGFPCNRISYDSSTQITCTTSPGQVGSKNVTVTNPDLQSALLADAYQYVDDGSSTGEFMMTVIGDKVVRENDLLTFSLSSLNGIPGQITYSCSSGCPSGLTVNPTSGQVDWTPNSSQVGSHTNVTFNAEFGATNSSRAISIVVIAATNGPTVSSITPDNCQCPLVA